MAGVEVAADQFLGLQPGDNAAVDRALVYLRHHVVYGSPVPERFVNRRVEAVKEPQLELVGALEQVLQGAEGEGSPALRRWPGVSARLCLGDAPGARRVITCADPTISRIIRQVRYRLASVLVVLLGRCTVRVGVIRAG